MNYELALSQLTVTAAMFGVIWIVQLVHYPMFLGLQEDSFGRWHAFHSNRITFVVGPLMISELLLSAWQALVDVDVSAFLLLGLTGAIWLTTFFISVPLHNSLGTRKSIDQALIERLVFTNWLRTALYTFKVVFLFWICFSGAITTRS